MKRRVIASLLTLVLCLTLLPAPAFAEEIGGTTPEPAATNIYVSSTGNDVTGAGSEAKPYATLAKAVDVAGSGATIYVMSNLTMTKCARYYNKNLTITSYGETRTVTRGDVFEQLSDNARSWYNPAMIEVQGNQEDAACGLTLTNIILDDDGKHMGTVFAQASSAEDHGDNTVYVQDAIIASNATVPCTITLSEGAVLRNFGGMSAVRVTERAELVMKSGSKIEDTTVTGRTKGKAQGEVGPAGAVWVQNASVEMKAGSEISKVIGRAVYVDGGEATIGGTISNITGNANMWQGTYGTAIHLRNSATGTLTATGLIENVTGGGTIVNLSGSTYTMDAGSIINNHAENSANPKTHGIYSVDSKADQRNEVRINGEICGINGNPLQIANTNVNIGETGNLHNNFVNYGALYLQKNATADIYGKINNNTATGRGGGIGTAGHGFVEINLYSGSEIKNNNSGNTGGGMSLKNCRLTMFGGEISNNTSKSLGGGIFLYENASAILREGLLGNNMDNRGSNDLSITANMNGNATNYLYISDKCSIKNPAVYMESGKMTVEATIGSRNLKLHNASKNSITLLTAEAQAKGWSSPLATFWVQRNGAVELVVDGLSPVDALPVYVLALPVDETGSVLAGAKAQVYAAQKTPEGDISLKLPDVSGNGFAVAIVQPTQDFGTLTISGPETIKQNKTNADYPVAYTVTYVMSESLKSIITQAGGNAEYNLAINQDTRLSGTPDRFDGNSIQVTYTLPNNAFVVGDSLFASAELTVTVGENSYIIPSNVTETKLLGIDSFNVVFDWNDGSGKTETVSVIEGEALGDKMIADPTRSGYTFTGWNTQQDGKGSSFDKSTVITGSLTVYAQWSMNSSGGGSSKTYYYLAVEKVDAQDGHTLNGAKFGLYLDSKQIATATSNRSGIALFRIDESAYRKITAESELYYQELAAPDGYIMSGDKVGIEKSDLTTSQTNAELNAETVRNYRNTAPADLNSSDHVAYVHGYPDGTVKPNHQITRAEVAMMLYRLLADTRMAEIQTTFNSFSDVSPDEWYNEAVSTMTNGKYIAGYPDGTFGGNKSITRAEFVTMLVRFIGVQDEACSFSDVSKAHWAYDYIATATQAGWIAGYSDGSFKPEQAITRAEAMTIINRVLNRGVDKNSELLNFKVWPDNTISDWFYYEVIEATNEHEYTGSRPSEQWTSLVIH